MEEIIKSSGKAVKTEVFKLYVRKYLLMNRVVNVWSLESVEMQFVNLFIMFFKRLIIITEQRNWNNKQSFIH